jgi:hypothetical protein
MGVAGVAERPIGHSPVTAGPNTARNPRRNASINWPPAVVQRRRGGADRAGEVARRRNAARTGISRTAGERPRIAALDSRADIVVGGVGWIVPAGPR